MEWLNQVVENIEHNDYLPLSWSAYNAKYVTNINIIKSIFSMLPQFKEDSHSVSLMTDAMQLIEKVTNFLNPGQTTVLVFDQPLYTIAKTIQWNMPYMFGENKFVIMLGGLHIEMGFLALIGSFVTGSGWVEALEESGVATSGKADSFLQGAHVKRSRHAHQVMACSLYQLLSDAYSESSATDFETFSNEKSSVLQFRFWLTTLELELLLLTFVHSLREGNFHLYIEALHKVTPWFFSLDRVNYSRYLPVHIRDMQALSRTHPDILRNFVEGKFVIRSSEKNFSSISIDQAHEQNNKHVKGQGGIIGLTANESAFNRWIVSGPEIAEMIQQFKESSKPTSEGGENEMKHHDEGEAFQEQFKLDLERLLVTMREYGNPFSEDSTDTSVVLHNGNLKTGKSVEHFSKIEEVGEKTYEAFVKERFVERTASISKTIPTGNFFIFNTETNRGKKQQQVTCLKNDVSLFSRLFIACQNQDGDLDNFFQYENQDYPPSISIFNELKSGNKADLLSTLKRKQILQP